MTDHGPAADAHDRARASDGASPRDGVPGPDASCTDGCASPAASGHAGACVQQIQDEENRGDQEGPLRVEQERDLLGRSVLSMNVSL